MALLLALARQVPAADAALRAGVWDRARFRGVEVHGKVLGILGLGRIGSLVASRAAAFGMRVVAFDAYLAAEQTHDSGGEPVTVDALYGVSGFIAVHLPLTPETRGFLGRDAFASMKQGVRIVNVSRGGIVDEAALADAIRSGHVAGAAVDVFAEEPVGDSPLFDLPGVVVTPHVGASTREAQDRTGAGVAEAVMQALRGGTSGG